jgi:hypothetical protein
MLVKLNTGRCGTAYDKQGRECGSFANQPGDEVEMPDNEAKTYIERGYASPVKPKKE